MADIPIIVNGYEVGATQTEVYCDVVNATLIVLYQNEDLLGTGNIVSKRCIITHLPLVQNGYALEAYTLERKGKSQVVVSNNVELTGWVLPSEVVYQGVTMTYTAWQLLANTNPTQYREIADLFKPQLTTNTNPDKDSLLKISKSALIFSNEKIYENGRTFVTIKDIQNAYGGYTVQFDDGAVGSSLQKIYTVSGTYKVKVVDLDNPLNFKEESYTITIQNILLPVVSTIEQLGYRPGYGDNGSGDFDVGDAVAFCPNQVEFRLLGAVPSGWIDGEGGQDRRWYRIFANVPAGLNKIEARVKSSVADFKEQIFTQ